MATLLKRGTKYYAKWFEGGRERRKSLKTGVRKTALERMALIDEAIYRGTLGVKGKSRDLTHEYAWKAYEERVDKSEISLYNEKHFWDQFWDWCGLPTLGSVKVHVLHEYKKHLIDKGYKPRTINSKLFQVGLVYTHLTRMDLYSAGNPFKEIERVRVKKDDVKFLPWDKVLTLLYNAKQHSRDMHLVFVLGALAGMRKIEICRARWEHVEWDEHRMFVDGTKNESSAGYIPLHRDLRAALEPYRQSTGWIVRPQNESGEYKYRWNWDKVWKAVVKSTATENSPAIDASPHTLRHSVATHLLDLGYTLAEIAKFLRHGDTRSTQIYADLKGVTMTIDRF